MYHIFFIHYSINGHLGSFHVLVIVNSAEMPPSLFVVIYIYMFPIRKSPVIKMCPKSHQLSLSVLLVPLILLYQRADRLKITVTEN